MPQIHSENKTRSFRTFFLALIKIPSLHPNIPWIYRKYSKVWCTHSTILAPSALLKEISPTCLYFCFACWSSYSACEADSLSVPVGLKQTNRIKTQVKRGCAQRLTNHAHIALRLPVPRTTPGWMLIAQNKVHFSTPVSQSTCHCNVQQCHSVNETVLQHS